MIKPYVIVLVYMICAIGLVLYIDGSLWSAGGAFVATMLIMFASWYHSWNKIQNALQSESAIQLAHHSTSRFDDELHDDLHAVADSKNKPSHTKMRWLFFRNGVSMSLAPWRFVAYMVLIVIFLALLRHGKLDVLSFLIGNFSALFVCVFALKYIKS